MPPLSYTFRCPTQLVFGAGMLARLPSLARGLAFRRTLLVADPGIRAAGHVDATARLLESGGIEVHRFHDFGSNPDTRMVERGRDFASPLEVDSMVALGGGSSLDCAKGINFLLTNGGRVQDYWGYGKAARPLLPMIAIPTTAGTGSEAQSYALISDAETHVKMACGDSKAAFRAAILDAELCLSQPAAVRAASGYDALSHAVETWVTTSRNPLSRLYSREAFRLLEGNFEPALRAPDEVEPLAALQLGAWMAGVAIENSMLGAAHACANPLTARYGIIHGVAIAALLPHAVRWNLAVAAGSYRELALELPVRLDQLAAAGGLANRLGDLGVQRSDLVELAQDAAAQWTGRFNPRPFNAEGALEIYQWAF